MKKINEINFYPIKHVSLTKGHLTLSIDAKNFPWVLSRKQIVNVLLFVLN